MINTKYELENIIYDTLMGNDDNELLLESEITEPCISRNEIVFNYKGKHVFIRIIVDDIK